jgi:hypothetical protein
MLVLGSVEVVRDRWCKLVPLYEVDVQGNLRQVVATLEFPPDGKIFWPAAEAVTVGDYLFCRVVENEAVAREGRKDAFRVESASASHAHEILDFRWAGEPDQVRLALMSGAVPLGRPLFAFCAGDRVVGPLKFKRTGASAPLELDVAHPDRIDVRRLWPGDYYQLANGKLFARKENGVFRGQLQGHVDWGPTDQVIKRALKFVVESARSSPTTPEERAQLDLLSKHARAALVDRNLHGASSEGELERSRLSRAVEFLRSVLAKEMSVGEEFVSLLRTHPKIQAELEEARAAAAAEARATAQKALDGERAEALREVELLRTNREALRREVEALASERAAVATGLEGVRAEAASVEAEISARLQVALARPAELLANVSLLRAAGLGATMSSGGGARPPPAGPSLRWSSAPPLEGDLVARLQSELRAVGVKSLSAQRMVAAFASKMVPVLLGPAGLEALDAFAQVACAGRRITVSVGPGFLDPGELVGVNIGQEFVPRSGGLLEALQAASGFAGPSLVVLEGANRAPIESYLMPLLRRRFLRAPVPTSVPIRGGGEFIVPERLLFAATAVAGATTLPMSADLWDVAVAVEVDRAPTSGSRNPPSEVAFEALQKPGVSNAAVVQEVLAEFPGAVLLEASLERYAAALSSLKDKTQVRAALFEGLVAPWLMSLSQEEREAVLEDGHAAPEQLAVLSRMRRRLS